VGVFSGYIFFYYRQVSQALPKAKEEPREGAEDKKEAHMSKRYAIWGIDVEWLSLRIVRAACGWITD
jgi:hypothetical protein